MTNILENSTGTTGGGRSSGRARYYNTHQACTVRVIAHRSLASSRLQTIQKERPLLGPESVAGDPQQISGVTVCVDREATAAGLGRSKKEKKGQKPLKSFH